MPREPDRAPTKARLVEAACEALHELTPADLLTAVGTREIARRAGISPAALFHHFGSVSALAEEVVARVFDPTTVPVEDIADLVEAVRRGLPADVGEAMHRAEFERVSTDPELKLRLGLWAFGGPAARSAYREFLRDGEDRLVPAAARLFDSWQRELRPPLELHSFVATQISLLQGSVIRHLVFPESVTRDDFARMAVALTMVALRVKGDHRDLRDRLSEMNYYPLTDVRAGRVTTGRGERTTALVLAAAAELFGLQGFDATTVVQVARRAGVAPSTVHALFGGKTDLAVALFRKQADDYLATRACAAGTPGERLRTHLSRLADFAGHRIDHAAPYLAALVARTAHDADPLVGSTAEHVVVAQQAGEVRTDLEALELAHALIVTLVGRVLNRPGEDAQAHVERTWLMLLG